MNRKPQAPHVLRSTRHLYGLSQARLAGMVGCATITIKNVENGTLQPSSFLAHRIFMQTGLDPGQLIENFTPETPFGVIGEPLTKDYLKHMQKARESSENREHVDQSVKHLSSALEIILDASIIRGHKLWAVRPALQNAIQKIVDEFELGSDVASLLLDRWGVPDLWSNASPASSFYTLVNTKGNIGKFAGIRNRAKRKRQEFYELQEMKRSGVKAKTRTKSAVRPRAKRLPGKVQRSASVHVASAA